MSPVEINRALRQKARDNGSVSSTKRYIRKCKLKMRFVDRIDNEIERTREKLDLLLELKKEGLG